MTLIRTLLKIVLSFFVFAFSLLLFLSLFVELNSSPVENTKTIISMIAYLIMATGLLIFLIKKYPVKKTPNIPIAEPKNKQIKSPNKLLENQQIKPTVITLGKLENLLANGYFY